MEKDKLIQYIILGVIFLLLLKLLKHFFGETSTEQKDENILIKLKNELQKKEFPTFAPVVYTNKANVIYEALRGFTEDEEDVYNVFRSLKNDLDVVLLIESFGLRRREFTLNKDGLSIWLNGYFSDGEMTKLNSILTAKGLKITF